MSITTRILDNRRKVQLRMRAPDRNRSGKKRPITHVSDLAASIPIAFRLASPVLAPLAAGGMEVDLNISY